MLNTMVLNIENDNRIHAVNKDYGVCTLGYKSLFLPWVAERTRGAIMIPGTRAAGIFTAGTAQRFINMQGYMVGKKVVILGSGDIGMIVARRLILEGAEVIGVVELLPYLSSLTRNKIQCLDDFDIPLYLSHTVVDIKGNERVEEVVVAPVDEKLKPNLDGAWSIKCDTLLLSVGLIPENELTKTKEMVMNPLTQGPVVDQMMRTSKENIFACGNVVHVNDLVDNVSIESKVAGRYPGLYGIKKSKIGGKVIDIILGEGIRYIIPNKVIIDDNADEDLKIYFRAIKPDTNVIIKVISKENILKKLKKAKINPGEIEQVTIHTDLLKDVDDDISIVCSKAE